MSAAKAPLNRAFFSGIRSQLAAAWEEVEPAFSYQYDAHGLERWDGKGEGPCHCLAFEGFGLSFSLFFGRMPRKDGC